MKKTLRRFFFLLIGGMFINSALYAQNITTLGAEDNTTAWWTTFSDPYTIEPNKTLTVEFVNHGSKVQNWNNWATILTKDVEWGTEGAEYLVMRADCYGWQYGLNTENNDTWYACNLNNYNFDNFKNDLDGANVKLSVKRNGTEVTLITDVTTAEDKKFRHYFVMDCGDGIGNIRAYLTVDNAHIDINNDATTVTDTKTYSVKGQRVGELNCSTPWWTAFSDYYTIEPNGSTEIHFKNYSCKVGFFHNWLAVFTTDADRAADGYKEFLALRADNYGWGDKWNEENITSNYDWDAFHDELDGADVTMTIVRDGANVNITAKQIAATDGVTERTETYTYADEASANQNIRVFLTTERGFLDILPEEYTDRVKLVDEIPASNAGSAIYNINGQRITKMQRGINIVNGKKVVVK